MASITRPDGTSYESMFPGSISPVPPFMDIHKLEWKSANGLTVQYSFEGDIFETEDQRNWSDSSYKTYSTPSALPKPVEVNPGDVIDQRVSLQVSGTNAEIQNDITAEIKESKVAFPQIGYGRSLNTPAFNQEIVDRLQKIPFDHYRVPVFMKNQEWEHVLIAALEEAIQVNTRLELIVYSGGNIEGEVQSLTGLLKNKQLLLKSILFVGEDGGFIPEDVLKKLYPVLKADLAAVKIGYGADAAFADLNQNPPGDVPFDFISFGLNPQAHTFDNLSILENLQSQPGMLESAQSLAKGKPVSISPITLNDRNLPGDDRQYSSLAAFWTLMALQNFSEAYSITFYELFGAAGLLETRETDLVKTSATYEVLAALCQFQPAWIIKRYAGNNLLMDGLLVENESGERLFFKPPPEYILW
jgi:hypothetical protein